jgi:Membrane dipeptidase (Peptidase family M19)
MGIGLQELVLPHYFCNKSVLAQAQSTKFPVEREKPGNLPALVSRHCSGRPGAGGAHGADRGAHCTRRLVVGFPNLTAAMEHAGWPEAKIRKMIGENWLRLLAEVGESREIGLWPCNQDLMKSVGATSRASG